MQDAAPVALLNENNSQNSQTLETDYEIGSTSATSPAGKQSGHSYLPGLSSNPSGSCSGIRQQHQRIYKYEPSVSDRESWWRTTIKDTPIPGTYDTHLNTFIKEVGARQMTYGFKSDGRRRDPQPLEPKGIQLLPGAYSIKSFVDRLDRLQLSYGFKGPERQELLKRSMTTNTDKGIDVPPGLYDTQKYQTINVPVEPAKHSFFKSKTTRNVFLPKLGPAPGDYEPKTNLINVNSRMVTSSFKSGTKRFYRKPSKVPGPGTYDGLEIFPTSKQISILSSRGNYYNANFTHRASAAV